MAEAFNLENSPKVEVEASGGKVLPTGQMALLLHRVNKVIKIVTVGILACGLAICLFFLGDFWTKRHAWDVAWRYENMDKTTSRPKITKISNMGEYWVLEGTSGCFAAMYFKMYLNKKTGILTTTNGRVVDVP